MDVLTKLGENATISLKEADPVNCCLDGYFFNCPENPMRFEKGMCNDYMAQRCARNWDNYCDIFLEQMDSKDVNGKAMTNFLSKAAEFKFCRDDTSNPNAHCVTACELVNPLAPGGAVVCKSVGDTVYRDQTQLYNISTDFSQSEGLNTTAPLKVAACPKTCDLTNNLDNTNRILNECLDRGVCQPEMMNLAENIVKNKIPVQNQRLQQFINQYIVTNPSKQIAQNVQLGGMGSQVSSFNPTIPGPTTQIPNTPVIPTTQVTEPFAVKEPFRQTEPQPTQQNKENITPKRSFIEENKVILTVLILLIIFILIIKN